MPRLTTDDLVNEDGLVVMFRGDVNSSDMILANPVVGITQVDSAEYTVSVFVRNQSVNDPSYLVASQALNGSVIMSNVLESTPLTQQLMIKVIQVLNTLNPDVTEFSTVVEHIASDIRYTRYADFI